MKLLDQLHTYAGQLENEFIQISEERKQLLQKLSHFVRLQTAEGKATELNFICTHNSRRSHLAQLWAQAAAAYYDIE